MMNSPFMAEQAALCILVKTKKPKIEWHFVVEFLSKAGLCVREIAQEGFYKRSGKWCSYCDYLPVCTGYRKKAQETLAQMK